MMTIAVSDDRLNFVISFPYRPLIVEEVRMLPGRRFNKISKTWTVPVKHAGYVFDFGLKFGAEFTPVAAEVLAQAESENPEEFDEAGSAPDVGDLSAQQGSMFLYEHQKDAVRFLVGKRKAILADDMGLGKTLSALTAAQKTGLPVYVISPASLIRNWEREANAAGVHLTAIFSWAKVPDEISDRKFTLIVDEAHYAQSGYGSKRGEKFLDLSSKATFVFLLTGTPIKNGQPINFMPLLQAIDHPQAANAREYQKFYCNAHATSWTKWDCSGAAHMDVLHERTKDKMLRRTKDECLDLPEKTRVFRMAETSESSVKRYVELFDKLRSDYRKRVIAGEAKGNAEELVLLGALRHAASEGKIETAVTMAREILEQGRKVVVFTNYVDTAKAIAKQFTQYIAKLITGDQPTSMRDASIYDFQRTDGDTRVLVCTFGSGGVGITLTKAQDVILVDRPWTPGDTVQAEDRLHRIGQKNAVTSYWVQWPLGGVDEMIDSVLDSKQERIELILHGKRKTLRGTESMGDVSKMVAQSLLEEDVKIV